MEKITELINPPIVGKIYLVPVVKTKAASWTTRTIPALGEFHWDKDIIRFPHEHIHIDFRFLSKTEFGSLSVPFAHVISRQFVIAESWEKRRCQRQMPKFPNQQLINWFPELERAYKDKQLSYGKCPHKGIDLRSINGDCSGNKVCPAHGLKWNKDGNLVCQTI